jgi:predicted dehydrogenase
VAYAGIGKTRDFSQVDDYCHLILHYPDGFRVSLKCSLLSAEQAPAYVLHGTRGSFVKFRSNVQEVQLAGGMKPDEPSFARESPETEGRLTLSDASGELVTSVYPSPSVSYLDFYERLAKALRGEGPVPVEPRDAVEGLRIIEAAYKFKY